MAETEGGWLVLTIEEAKGVRDSDGVYLWDSPDFEGFVRAELRGGSRNLKVHTKKVKVEGGKLEWGERLELQLVPGSKELRLMLCREKAQDGRNELRRGTTVIAACGIYVQDLLVNCPIDKYFELFKPQQGGDGGEIRVVLNHYPDASQIPPSEPGLLIDPGTPQTNTVSPETADLVSQKLDQFNKDQEEREKESKSKRRTGLILGLVLPLVAAAAAVGVSLARRK